MNNKQQQLTFSKGITNVPSDALCSDNALAESIGMVYDDSEHRVIQKPEPIITSAVANNTSVSIPKIIFVHKFNNQERFIGITEETVEEVNTYTLWWGTVSNKVYTRRDSLGLVSSMSVRAESVGKTMIISDDNGMSYYLWKNDSYMSLGSTIPEPDVNFRIMAASPSDYEDRYVHEKWNNNNGGNWDSSIIYPNGRINDQEAYNNLVIGYYRKLCNKAAEKRCFTRPFFARYALELYDGGYTYISNPVALFPSITKNGFASLAVDGSWNSREFLLAYAHMYFRSTTDYRDWADLVRGVCIFISSPVDVVDTESDQVYNESPESTEILWDGIWYNDSIYSEVKVSDDPDGQGRYFTVYKFNDSPTILNKLKESSNFYKLCDIGLLPNAWTDVSDKTDSNVLRNLTTQSQLPYDDYFSHSTLKPNFMYSYNSRLNIADVTRTFFDGFTQFLPYKNVSRTYDIYVHISTDSGDRVVKKQVTTDERMGLYFYYPDSRAKRAEIFSGDYKYCDLLLEEHPYLHGAYYFGALPTGQETDTTTAATRPEVNNSPEYLANYIIQSEVDDPFIFRAAGYFKVGTGKIYAMSSVTQALSEGQFGQYPLLVFSESGIWALSVASTGYYSSIHPMSREVSNDPPCLIQTDGAVFFTSKKGLMVVVGSQVKCVSEQMSGKTNIFKDGNNVSLVTDLGDFVDYLKSAYIAYDYRDSLLWIFNSGYTTCYTYSIKSGTFSKFTPSTKITNVVNCYPDYLLQDPTKVYSLMGRNDINKDGTTSDDVFTPNRYSACIFTRPMKLENALALKSIMQVKHIHEMNTTATLVLRIFASNNLKNWTELTSLRGIPWKYYRFRFDFTNLIATDRFAGTMLITQERRIDKMR